MPRVKTGFEGFFLLNRKIMSDWYRKGWKENVEHYKEKV